MERYQDYVIRDGEFVGEFEAMYQKFDNPWSQIEEAEESYSRNAMLLSLNRFNVQSAVEIGCGLGYTTNMIKLAIPEIDICGIDISDTAIKKANQKFPDIRFYVSSVNDFTGSLENSGGVQCLIFAEVMWYILDDLPKIIDDINVKFRGRLVMINQTFYKGQQQYGRDFFTNVDEMIKYLGWECLVKQITDTGIESIATHCVLRI